MLQTEFQAIIQRWRPSKADSFDGHDIPSQPRHVESLDRAVKFLKQVDWLSIIRGFQGQEARCVSLSTCQAGWPEGRVRLRYGEGDVQVVLSIMEESSRGVAVRMSL